MQTTVLAPPVAPGAVPSLAVIEEATPTCPQYQSVPPFQRVQITGDYASGVGTARAAPSAPWPSLCSLPAPQQCPGPSFRVNYRSLFLLQWGECLPLCLTSIWGCPAASLGIQS